MSTTRGGDPRGSGTARASPAGSTPRSSWGGRGRGSRSLPQRRRGLRRRWCDRRPLRQGAPGPVRRVRAPAVAGRAVRGRRPDEPRRRRRRSSCRARHPSRTALGRAISWEVFFGDRVREGVEDGAEVVLNPATARPSRARWCRRSRSPARACAPSRTTAGSSRWLPPGSQRSWDPTARSTSAARCPRRRCSSGRWGCGGRPSTPRGVAAGLDHRSRQPGARLGADVAAAPPAARTVGLFDVDEGHPRRRHRRPHRHTRPATACRRSLRARPPPPPLMASASRRMSRR